MREIGLRSRSGLTLALLCVWLPTASPPRAALAVDCDAGSTISGALVRAKPGVTLLVSGTCHESVLVPAELVRVTLDGQGNATIDPGRSETLSGPASHAVFIRGKGITITGFRITGGGDGVHLSGPAHAVIDGNVITHNSGRGIHLDKSSVAQITNNTIADNGGVGIHVTEQSYARIGFLTPPDEKVRPNTIRNNGGGIHVERVSSAWIVGNAIVGNKGPGIAIDRGSEADIVANDIGGNSGDAIEVTHNSGVNLQSEGSRRREGPNRTDPARKNAGFGVRCSIGGYVAGPLGTVTGMQGATRFDASCIDRLTH